MTHDPNRPRRHATETLEQSMSRLSDGKVTPDEIYEIFHGTMIPVEAATLFMEWDSMSDDIKRSYGLTDDLTSKDAFLTALRHVANKHPVRDRIDEAADRLMQFAEWVGGETRANGTAQIDAEMAERVFTDLDLLYGRFEMLKECMRDHGISLGNPRPSILQPSDASV
jgi:hypothetical protein